MSIAKTLTKTSTQFWDAFFNIAPLLFLCAIPLGNTLRSIGFVTCIIAALINKNSLESIQYTIRKPWYLSLFFAVLWSILSFTWSPASLQESKFYLNKCLLMMAIPIIITAFNYNKNSKHILDAFLVTMLIPFALSLIKLKTSWQWHADNDPGSLFYNHIITGLYTTFATFIAIEMFLKYKKYYYLGAWALFSIQVLCINTGKMSYILYLLVMSFTLWPHLNKTLRWSALLLSPALIYAIYWLSPAVGQGIGQLANDWQQFQQGQLDTSLGFRIQFHHFAYQLFSKHWLLGGGLGYYDHMFKLLNPVPGWPYQPNTHSQFWFFLSDTGCIGMSLWLIFFGCLVRESKNHGWYGHLFQGFLLIFAMNCFSDNLLFASPISLLMALWGLTLSAKLKAD